MGAPQRLSPATALLWRQDSIRVGFMFEFREESRPRRLRHLSAVMMCRTHEAADSPAEGHRGRIEPVGHGISNHVRKRGGCR